MRLEQEQIDQQQQKQIEQARQQAGQQLTVRSLFDVWFPIARADNTQEYVDGVRRTFELHFLPVPGEARVADITAEHFRGIVKTHH